jgi:hypothetical protein
MITIRKALLTRLLAGFLTLPALSVSRGAEPGHRFKLRDLPPSALHASVSPTAPPKLEPILEAVGREVARHAGSTNQNARDVTAEVRDLKSKLLALEAAADAEDPSLRVYGAYVGRAHDWVMKTHGREFREANRYFSSSPADLAKRRTQDDLVALIDMALYKQLASNTNFAPLLKSTFVALETRMPGRFAASYARNDALIGFHPKSPARPAATFEAYLDQLDRRYDLVIAELDEIQRKHNVPTGVITGWMYGDLYRMLDGDAQLYVEFNTPRALKTVRQRLRRKLILLSDL